VTGFIACGPIRGGKNTKSPGLVFDSIDRCKDCRVETVVLLLRKNDLLRTPLVFQRRDSRQQDWRGDEMISAVILAGGKGTRFWPLSRENCPKQMPNIVGEDTLLRQTIKRLDGFISLDKVWIITTDILAQDIRFHLKPLGRDADRIRYII
jgi:hypothetical protein